MDMKILDEMSKSRVNTSYRADIDGLRGIAVLLVVLYHGFPTRFTGGFVGVDIFFVISGFLISNVIIEGLQENRFSFLDFYARRIRRIFPALALVLFASFAFGWFVLFPGEYQQLGKYIGGGAGFIGNIVTLNEAGYFDTRASLKPLLHLWSLGVEEQFYFVWPILLFLSWRWRFGALAIASIILVVSFVVNMDLTATDPTAAFYLPITRFWELMLGCLLATIQAKRISLTTYFSRQFDFKSTTANFSKEATAVLGIVLISAASYFVTSQKQFPGTWALVPTVGAMLLIAVGGTSFIGRWFLANRALVYVGLISYPLYLWHWPILSFARIIHYEEPS